LGGENGFDHITADTTREGPWQDAVGDSQAIINLAGTPIFRRWTAKAKAEIRDSRILTTRHLVQAMATDRNTFLFSASGVGYYGDCGDQPLTEDAEAGKDFLAHLSIDWEKEALAAEARGARVVIGRFGVILHLSGGALPKMLPAYRMGVGGPLGSGRQWFPWIHLEDLIAAIDFLRQCQDARGVFNFCGPEPVTNRHLARTLGRLLHRPALLPAPAFMMRLALGEFSDVLLGSQRCVPQRLLDSGFVFRYPTIEAALKTSMDPTTRPGKKSESRKASLQA
jgi:uncharacterized protein (TIGR01777 family)